MPNGETHYKAWRAGIRRFALSSAIGATTGILYRFYNPSPHTEAITWVAFFFNAWAMLAYYSGKYYDPDLDQPGVSQAEGRMRRDFSYFGYILVAWWSVYANFMGLLDAFFKTGGTFGWAHRSKLTHKTIPGTLFLFIWSHLPLYMGLLSYKSIFGLPDFINPLSVVVYLLGTLYGLGVTVHQHIWMDNRYGDGEPSKTKRKATY